MNLFLNLRRSLLRLKEPVVMLSKKGMNWLMRLQTVLRESESSNVLIASEELQAPAAVMLGSLLAN